MNFYVFYFISIQLITDYLFYEILNYPVDKFLFLHRLIQSLHLVIYNLSVTYCTSVDKALSCTNPLSASPPQNKHIAYLFPSKKALLDTAYPYWVIHKLLYVDYNLTKYMGHDIHAIMSLYIHNSKLLSVHSPLIHM